MEWTLEMHWKGLLKTLALSLITIAGVGTGLHSLFSASVSDHSRTYTYYDHEFKYSTSKWLPDYDYRWLLAQCKQESNLDAFAISPVGAKGYCQFMPGTWADCQLALGFVASPYNPNFSIRCAGWYMGGRVSVWNGRGRIPIEKLRLAQASYNCGTGCVLKGQRKCGDAKFFKDIAPCLPLETREYPPRIEKHYNEYTAKDTL